LKGLQILPRHKLHAQRLRYHGNYALENLHYTGKEFLIANFEGNLDYSYGERHYKRSPLLDVASMLFSLSGEKVLLSTQKVEQKKKGEISTCSAPASSGFPSRESLVSPSNRDF